MFVRDTVCSLHYARHSRCRLLLGCNAYVYAYNTAYYDATTADHGMYMHQTAAKYYMQPRL